MPTNPPFELKPHAVAAFYGEVDSAADGATQITVSHRYAKAAAEAAQRAIVQEVALNRLLGRLPGPLCPEAFWQQLVLAQLDPDSGLPAPEDAADYATQCVTEYAKVYGEREPVGGEA